MEAVKLNGRATGRNGQPLRVHKEKSRRLSLAESYKLMQYLDCQRERIEGKMTYTEILTETQEKTGLVLTFGNIQGALHDLGLKVRRDTSGRSKIKIRYAERIVQLETKLADSEAAATARASELADLSRRVQVLEAALNDLLK